MKLRISIISIVVVSILSLGGFGVYTLQSNAKEVLNYQNNFNTQKDNFLNTITEEEFNAHIKFDLEDLQSIDQRVNSEDFKAKDIEAINVTIETEKKEILDSLTTEIHSLESDIETTIDTLNKDYTDSEITNKEKLIDSYNTAKVVDTVTVQDKIKKYNNLVSVQTDINEFIKVVDERIKADEEETKQQATNSNNNNSNNNSNSNDSNDNSNNSSNNNSNDNNSNDNTSNQEVMPDYCFASEEEAWAYGEANWDGWTGFAVNPGCGGNMDWWDVYFY